MDINSAKLVLHAAALADDAVLIEGKHGIGKSDIVRQFSKETYRHMEALFLSHQEVGDIIGIPRTIEKDGETITTWSVPIWLQRMREKAAQGIKCVLFLDELNRAPLDVRQSALQLVLERRIHEHELPIVDGERTMIVAAINPADDYQVDELDPALLDRFLPIYAEVDAKSWLKWAKETSVNEIVRDFIAENPDRLHWSPADGSIGSSPRSWAKLGNYMDNIDRIEPSVIFQIMKGKVGTEIGSQFHAFAKNYTKVIKVEDIEKVVKKYADSVSDIDDLSLHITELMGATEAIQKMEMANKLKDKYGDKDEMLPFLAYLYSIEIEILVAFLKSMRSDDPDAYKKLALVDGKVNNKELFRRIVVASEKG